jgi:hypothetical protein
MFHNSQIKYISILKKINKIENLNTYHRLSINMSHLIKRRIPTTPLTHIVNKDDNNSEQNRPVFMEPIYVPKSPVKQVIVGNTCVVLKPSQLPVLVPVQPFVGYVQVNKPVVCVISNTHVKTLPRMVPNLVRF